LKAQRLRFRYRLTGEAGALSNRDLVRIWDDAITGAGFNVARSEGRRASPQVALAAPIPLGMTSHCEIADIFLSEPADPDRVLASLQPLLPSGIEAVAVTEVGVDTRSLQSQLRWAEYEVTLSPGTAVVDDLRDAVARLLAADSLPSEYQRANRVKTYDLRPLILAIYVAGTDTAPILRMRLRAEPERTARADQVVLALALPAAAATRRTRLELDEVPVVTRAHRRASYLDGE